jgi:hypothetical protein
MNEDWEELLLKTRSAINREKYLASVTSRQKAADAALKPAFYVGKDPHSNQELVQINGGNLIVAKSVTNGQIKPGDAVQPIQSLGSYSINALPHIPLKEVEEEAPKVKKGDGRFKVLFSKVKDGIRTFYVGGHTKKPVKAFSIPVAQTPYGIGGAFIGNTGMGKYDFMIDYLYDSGLPDTSTTPPGHIILKGYYAVGQEGLKEAYALGAGFCGYGFWGGGFMNDTSTKWDTNTRDNNQNIVNSGVYYPNEGSGSFSRSGSSKGTIRRNSIYKGVPTNRSTVIEATETGKDETHYSLAVTNNNSFPYYSFESSSDCIFSRSGSVAASFLASPKRLVTQSYSLSVNGSISAKRSGVQYDYNTTTESGQYDYRGSQFSSWNGSGFLPYKNELKSRKAIYYTKLRTLQKGNAKNEPYSNAHYNSEVFAYTPINYWITYQGLACKCEYPAADAAVHVGVPFLSDAGWWQSNNDPGVVTVEEKFHLSNEYNDEMIYDLGGLDQDAYRAITYQTSQLVLTKDNISRIFWPNVDNNAILSTDSTGIARVWNVSGGMAREEDREGIIYSLGLSQTDNYTIHYISYYPEDAI